MHGYKLVISVYYKIIAKLGRADSTTRTVRRLIDNLLYNNNNNDKDNIKIILE